MSLKSRIDRLSREREQAILFSNGLPSREYPGMPPKTYPNTVPYTPQQPGETDAAWTARIEALGRELFPQAELVLYPHTGGDSYSMATWMATRDLHRPKLDGSRDA
jgi:hypothetical protein